MNAITATTGSTGVFQKAFSQKWSFLVAFVLVFAVTLRICMVTGFIPNPVDFELPTLHGTSPAGVPELPLQTSPLTASAGSAPSVARADGALNMGGEMPVKISVPSIGLSATISNPASTNIEKLDEYLLTGAVRYPTSATLGQNGNVVLFGHSSYLPVVVNQAFKTFDGIQKLKAGDQITVYSTTHSYTYAVTNVSQDNVGSNVGIPLSTNGAMLTLATCDSFGKKTDRFVVSAKLIGSSVLGS
jgi:LPXTG-site transpeptidase (sortase) family protein